MNKDLLSMISVIIVLKIFGIQLNDKKLSMLRPLFITVVLLMLCGVDTTASKEKSGNDGISKNGRAMLDRNSSHLYKSSIDYLNERTPIDLIYSEETKTYIDHYIVQNPDQFGTIMGRSDFYFPMFEEKLANNNLPLELKNIAIIESALNPLAVSKSGAVGLWQFLFHTSKMFNLRIDSYVDERRDPEKSTDAACEYLKYLYRIFNDWQLAITAYNGGPGMIEMAIEKSGGKTDYLELRPYLTEEARNYYPKFVAACYATRFYKRHDIESKAMPFKFYDLEMVKVKKSVWFKQIVSNIDISIEDLKTLNPVYKQNYVPVYGQPAALFLPKQLAKEFNRKEREIYACLVENKDYHDLRAEVGNVDLREKTVHYVKRGEYFHKIAMQYDCTIYDIMAWNGLETKSISAGQPLNIFKFKTFADADLVTKLKFVNPTEDISTMSHAEYRDELLQNRKLTAIKPSNPIY